MLQKTIFNKTDAITPAQKLDQIFAKAPGLKDALIANFRRMNPKLKCFADLELPDAGATTLDKALIDPTLQRPAIADWLFSIINEFMDSKVMVLNVFHDDINYIGLFLTWDGQHTLLSLYFIAVYVFEEDPATCNIPISVHKSQDRAVIREAFLSANGGDKKGLSDIDKFQQWVYRVRIDGSIEEKYIKAEKTQQYLEAYRLFLVNSYEDHADEYGAITRMVEIKKYDSIRTRDFGEYRQALGRKAPAIQPKEQVMMYEYFKLCEENNIKLTTAYIKRLVSVFKIQFGADFSADGSFWTMAKEAYLKWHRDDMKRRPLEQQCGATFSPELGHGMPYLLQQLEALKFKGIPKYASSTPFRIPKEDLWS